MAETEPLFGIFCNYANRQTRNIPRQSFFNNENMGKAITSGPVKPNEPLKKGGETKKSFLSNTGKALQTTPGQTANILNSVKKAFSEAIYNDVAEQDKFHRVHEELEFTPDLSNDKDLDVLDFKFLHVNPKFEYKEAAPAISTMMPELDSSVEDDFFRDDFSKTSTQFEEDNFPNLSYEDSSFGSDDDLPAFSDQDTLTGELKYT